MNRTDNHQRKSIASLPCTYSLTRSCQLPIALLSSSSLSQPSSIDSPTISLIIMSQTTMPDTNTQGTRPSDRSSQVDKRTSTHPRRGYSGRGPRRGYRGNRGWDNQGSGSSLGSRSIIHTVNSRSIAGTQETQPSTFSLLDRQAIGGDRLQGLWELTDSDEETKAQTRAAITKLVDLYFANSKKSSSTQVYKEVNRLTKRIDFVRALKLTCIVPGSVS
jgi:hypothetical protein